MQVIDNDKEKLGLVSEGNSHSALELICKKGYGYEAAAKKLKISPSDLKIRIRKELNKYRE